MTMHLHHPSLSLAGKKRGKVKFRNADEARKARELAADWEKLKSKWDVPAKKEKRVGKIFEPLHTAYKLSTPVGRTTSRDLPSRVTPGGSTAPVHKVYTGDQILGVTIIHKSCLQPVFNRQEAIDAATMRR